MERLSKTLAVAAFAAVCAFALVACGGQSQDEQTASEAAEEAAAAAQAAEAEAAATREQIEAILEKARLASYDTVTVTQNIETTATGVDEEGQRSTQSTTSTMVAELRNDEKKPAIHMAYEAYASNQPGKTEYDMYVDKDSFYVVQGDQLYTDSLDKETAAAYIQSMFSIISENQVKSLLDVASSYKVQESDGDTAVSITVDVSKLADTNLVDMSSLPEGASIATLVVSYVVGPDDYLKTVRLMSATTGAPTYRVNQRYQFSGYNDTKLPDWPDLSEYAKNNADIKYDDEGNMYIVGEDGVEYFIDSFEPDGTVRVHTNQPSEEEAAALQAQQAQQEQAAAAAQPSRRTSGGSGGASTQPASSQAASPSAASGISGASFTEGDASQVQDSEIDDPTFVEGDNTAATDTSSGAAADSGSTSGGRTSAGGGNSGSASTSDSTQTSSSEQGRAYITAYDGTVHYLDEPGSEIRNIGGSRVFIDANGEWYFLSEE